MAFGGGCGAFRPHFPSSAHKSAAGEIEIGEREEREHLRAVLGDAAIADLAVAELAFQHPEHVLDLGAHLAEAAVPGTLALREVAVRLRLLFHRPQHAGRFRRALLFFARIALVAKTAASSSRMRLAITLASCTLPVVTPAVCTSPLSASTPTCAFIPKYHWFPFFDELISGSRFCSLFFVEGEAAISVASSRAAAKELALCRQMLGNDREV